MNFDQQTYELIEAYLDKTLSEQEHKAFEERMALDTSLMQEVAINREMRVQYGNSGDTGSSLPYDLQLVERLKNDLKSEETNELSEKIKKGQRIYEAGTSKKPTITLKYLYYAAAAIALIFLVNTFLVDKQTTSQKLFAEYKDWKTLPSLKTKGENSKDLTQGETLFFEEKYTQAVSVFDNYKNSKNPHVLIYLGVSYLELDDHDNAVDIFTKLIKMDTLDHTKGYWYMALTYLKQENYNKAIEYLQIIRKDQNNYNYVKAEKLLLEINHINSKK